MKNFADRLLEKIELTNNPTVMGIDPLIEYVPKSIKDKYLYSKTNVVEATALAITEFNMRLLDCVKGIIPAVKPQLAYFEMMGSYGIKAFEQTIDYANKLGYIVIADAKRNDILSTASSYAKAFLGKSAMIDSSLVNVFKADAVTINPYLGFDGVKPFITECENNNTGIFILVRTSNPSAGDFQDILTNENEHLYELVAKKVAQWGETLIGEKGYSSVGAVVGATWPKQAKVLREIMPNSIILVPGYGAQGGGASEAVASFDKNGYGAIVNASRSLMCAYKKDGFDHEEFEIATQKEALRMKQDLNSALLKI